MATAFWNLFGAGVLGFLINLPFVNYFQHGSFLTAAHGHGALMGVYGMLAIALALFSLRNIVNPRYWKEKWLMVSFWGLNAGQHPQDVTRRHGRSRTGKRGRVEESGRLDLH